MGIRRRETHVLRGASSQNHLKQTRYIKDSVCRNNLSNPDEQKTSMSNITARISPATLQAVSTDMPRRAQLYPQHVFFIWWGGT
jgi:hypothetical protein